MAKVVARLIADQLESVVLLCIEFDHEAVEEEIALRDRSHHRVDFHHVATRFGVVADEVLGVGIPASA